MKISPDPDVLLLGTFSSIMSWMVPSIHFILSCLQEKNSVHVVAENGEQIDAETRVQKYSAGVCFVAVAEALPPFPLNLSHIQQDVF